MTTAKRATTTQTTISDSSSVAWGALLFLLTVVGCANHPHFTPTALPDWAVPAAPAGRADVYLPDVPSPNPATATEVTLAELLVFADTHAPAVQVARARSRRGYAGMEAASPLLQENPEFAFGFGGRTIAHTTFFETEVSVQQRIEIAGERGLRVETAERSRELALAQLDETRWAVHVEIHTLFFEVLIAKQRVDAAEQVLRFAQDLDGIAARRVEAGEDSPLTRLVAQAEYAQARERLVEAHRKRSATRTRLAEVAGWPADGLGSLQGELPVIRRSRDTGVLVRLAAENHPSFRVGSLAVAEAETRVRLETREAWPEPALGMSYGREGESGVATDVWLVTVGVPLPLWNRNQGGRAHANVALDVARTEQEALHTKWRGRLERIAQSVNAAAERVAIYGADVLPTVERNLALIRRAYDLGEIDIHSVSQTRERVLETQGRAIDARSAYFRSLAQLEGLVGTEVQAALQEVIP